MDQNQSRGLEQQGLGVGFGASTGVEEGHGEAEEPKDRPVAEFAHHVRQYQPTCIEGDIISMSATPHKRTHCVEAAVNQICGCCLSVYKR